MLLYIYKSGRTPYNHISSEDQHVPQFRFDVVYCIISATLSMRYYEYLLRHHNYNKLLHLLHWWHNLTTVLSAVLVELFRFICRVDEMGLAVSACGLEFTVRWLRLVLGSFSLPCKSISHYIARRSSAVSCSPLIVLA